MPVGIRTEGLRKVFSEVVALDDLTLEVRPGEIFGLLGPNGAGKSTTVGVLTTRVRPTAGRAWVGDFDVWKNGIAVKRLIGVVPQQPNLDFSLTAREIFTFHGALFSMVMAPMIFFGCTYYPWSALAKFPILKRVVLINPLVYASEGFRRRRAPGVRSAPVQAQGHYVTPGPAGNDSPQRHRDTEEVKDKRFLCTTNASIFSRDAHNLLSS